MADNHPPTETALNEVHEMVDSLDHFTFEYSDSESETSDTADQSSEFSDDEPTSSSSGDSMTCDGSAAETVFAIPELLEMIILAHADKYAGINPSNQALMSPLKILYALQRVNKDCRNFIIDSKKCRRLMFIDPPRCGSQEAMMFRTIASPKEFHNLQPLWWLFQAFDINDPVNWELTDPLNPNVYFREIEALWSDHALYSPPTSILTNIQLGKKILRTAMTGMRREEASWRKLKLFRVANGPHETLTFHQLFRMQGVTYRWYRVELTVSNETRLGEFWDWWTGACVLSYLDHYRVRDALELSCKWTHFGRGRASYRPSRWNVAEGYGLA